MPIIMFTEQEVFDATIKASREASDEIVRLADLTKAPLAPGESVAARHHQIAKLGKALADAFIHMDDMMSAKVRAHVKHGTDVTAATDPHDTPPDPNAN